MMTELALTRRLRRFALAAGLTLAAAAAHAQDLPPASASAAAPTGGDGYAAAEAPQDADQAAPQSESRSRRHRAEIHPYLEVTQVLSAELESGGETLTYTTVAAGVDGSISTRRVTAQVSYRYERDIAWEGNVADQDVHSGVAMVSAQIVPGALSLDAGALATRTAGDGRVFGVTNRDSAVNVYSFYAGPTVATHAGPLAINAAYRFGYVEVDDDRANGTLDDDFDHSSVHSFTASLGMAPGTLPFGWTVGGGYVRENSGGRFDQRFEGGYIRGDVVVPVGPTLALTAGVGYENMQSDQRDFVRDVNGFPVIGPNGPIPDPNAPRLLTYDLDGVMYDGGILWRPSSRTELQVRAGHRYGGTTVVGSVDHRFNPDAALHGEVFDSVETFGHLLTTDLNRLPSNFDAGRDVLTGGLGGCVFGGQGGGVCLDRSLQSINGNTFRMRGGNLVVSGTRGLWSYGVGAGYANRRYYVPVGLGQTSVATEDETYSVYGTVGRRLSRTSQIDFTAFASWYDSDLVGTDGVSTIGANVDYSRTFMLDRLQLLAALGLYHSDSGSDSSTVASGLAGLRYTF
ncbi:MAG TPA: hypothetical protein VIT38_01950 [Allosphingosinicella sp.]